MDFLDLAKSRYSVREYDSRSVEEEKIVAILTAGQVAPTAANIQPIKIIVVESKEALQKIAMGANIFGAPLAFIVCADVTKAWKRPFDGKCTGDIDASIITDHMMLEATSLGLGSVWETYFKADIISREFDLPTSLEPINILAVGYGKGKVQSSDRHSKTRKSLNEIVTRL